MKNKIIAFVLALTLLSGTTVYAVPSDLWNGDERVVSLFAEDNTATNFDVIQKVLDYIGVAEKDYISGESAVKSSVFLRALAEIVGFSYDADVETNKILEDLKKVNVLRDDVKASYITLPEVLYAGARITGWVEAGADEGTVYTQAKRAGLMRNIAYSNDRNLTGLEAAQILYNILSVNTKMSFEYRDGYISLNKKTEEPILKSKYGIVMKQGIVTAVFGESVYNTTTLKENEIELDGKVYMYNPEESQANLLGRSVVLFVEEETECAIFAETTTDNIIHTINYGEEPMFKTFLIEYCTNEGEEHKLKVTDDTIVIYNGMQVGSYSIELMTKYFKEGTNIVAVDNDKDDCFDYIILRQWESFPVLLDAGSEGIIKFDHGRTYEGKSYIDLTPEDDTVHITVLNNGELVAVDSIKAGDIISISANANKVGHKYIIVEKYTELVSGELASISDDMYNVNGTYYHVSQDYLDAQVNVPGVNKPVIGQVCTFYIDTTGRIANATLTPEYSYGYIVKISTEKGLNPTCKLKIFTSGGVMEEIHTAEKIKLHDEITLDGRMIEPLAFAQYVAGKGDENEDGDYRCLIQYKLNAENKINKVWFPIDNTGATEFGKSEYQFTKDVENSSYVTYASGGIVGGKFWGGSTLLFGIPDDKDAIDSRYSIKSPSYSSKWENPTEFYCVDEFNTISVAVLHVPEDTYIDSYKTGLMVVHKVVESIVNDEGETGYKIYGTINAEPTSYLAKENIASLAGVGGWYDGVKLTELKFGDIIQVYQADESVQLFRLVYRVGIQDDYIKNVDGGKKDSGRLAITTGTFVAQRGNAYKLSQTVSGVTNTFLKFFSATATANIIDTSNKKVTRTTVADLVPGDKIVIHSRSKVIRHVYIIR